MANIIVLRKDDHYIRFIKGECHFVDINEASDLALFTAKHINKLAEKYGAEPTMVSVTYVDNYDIPKKDAWDYYNV